MGTTDNLKYTSAPIPEFRKFGRIPRLYRECIVTEKIDGTNAVIHIDDDGNLTAGSRNRWLTVNEDNFGFAKWVEENRIELRKLGPGYHYGEWFGKGIQRGYGLSDKKFALFNVSRWKYPRYELVIDEAEECPACCMTVPILYIGKFFEGVGHDVLKALMVLGSVAVPGYNKPEGVVIYHTAAKQLFKTTFENDDTGKEG